MKRIGILVVHGIGEQGCFEHLEAIAGNLYKALVQTGKIPNIQVCHGDQVPRHSTEHGWGETPVLIRWASPSGEEIETDFREVHWADLDLPMTWSRWAKLVKWVFGMPGVRMFRESWVLKFPGMIPPKPLDKNQERTVRIELFRLSLLSLLLFLSVDLLYGLLTRFSFRALWLKKVRGLIYDYLGDVQLYQDWTDRTDNAVEAVGDYSRIAIRRRMVRALVQIAADTTPVNGVRNLDQFYILAHSLGTVVAFNAIMEHELILPNYLTESEWNELPGMFKSRCPQSAGKVAPQDQQPRRPPWLDADQGINRGELFKNLRCLVTMGSPLNKFASLWPAIVPVNTNPCLSNVCWVNVQDAQNIVGGSIHMFPKQGSPPTIGGLSETDVEWADQKWLFLAHTNYWEADSSRNNRLINRMIDMLESDGRTISRPEDTIPLPAAKRDFWCVLAGFAFLAMAFVGFLFWAVVWVLAGLGHDLFPGLAGSWYEWWTNRWMLISLPTSPHQEPRLKSQPSLGRSHIVNLIR